MAGSTFASPRWLQVLVCLSSITIAVTVVACAQHQATRPPMTPGGGASLTTLQQENIRSQTAGQLAFVLNAEAVEVHALSSSKSITPLAVPSQGQGTSMWIPILLTAEQHALLSGGQEAQLTETQMALLAQPAEASQPPVVMEDGARYLLLTQDASRLQFMTTMLVDGSSQDEAPMLPTSKSAPRLPPYDLRNVMSPHAATDDRERGGSR